MQSQINKFLVLLVAIVIVGAAGCVTDSPQNNATNNSNQNVSNRNTANQNTPNQNTPANTAPLKPVLCNSVNQQDIQVAINSLPPELKNQFKSINPTTGTIEVTFDPVKSEMVFKGYLTSDGNNLQVFFNRFNQFRGRQCVKGVYFQGAAQDENFEWRPATPITPPPPSSCKANVDNTMNNGAFGSQIKNKNLEYAYDDKTGILTLSGYIGDIPSSNGQLDRFLADLRRLVADGCIAKVVFAEGARSGAKPLSERGFGWMLCEPPLVECAGECVSSCPGNGNTNTNTVAPTPNTNTNAR